MDAIDVIVRPLITERSMDAVTKGKFTFEVVLPADKKTIKRVIEETYKVHVISVATRIIKGRSHRVGIRRAEVKKSPIKKATVELKSGEKINAFEVGS